MDAPALPPSRLPLQMPSQSDTPALVSTTAPASAVPVSADGVSADSLSTNTVSAVSTAIASQSKAESSVAALSIPESSVTEALPEGAVLSVRAIDFNLLPNPKEARSTSTVISQRHSWLPATQLTQSFDFIGRAFHAARLESRLRFFQTLSQLSATVPIQWARSNSWKSWAKTAQIQVTAVGSAETERTETEHTETARAQRQTEVWSASFVSHCLIDSRQTPSQSPTYRLSLRETTLGYVADRDQAYLLAQQLERLIRSADFDADQIAPRAVTDAANKRRSEFEIGAADRTLLSVTESMADAAGYSQEWAAVAWANNLRMALKTDLLGVGDAQMNLKRMEPSDITLKGEASWYGPYFHGRATANGEVYNQHDLTVAHKSLPFGTHLKVRNLENGRTVVVRVNDRGPYVGDRSLDLSNAAANCLGSEDTGVIPYEAVILKNAK